jgi:NAD-dependent deacetylase sirtuin 2
MIMDDSEAAANVPIPWCLCDETDCLGNVKPDIVFFGESLPPRYFDLRKDDMGSADLLLVMGSSLQVGPFNTTHDFFNMRAPRLLINRESVGEVTIETDGCGFRFDKIDNYRDVRMLGSCDECVVKLCKSLGWDEELIMLRSEYISRLEVPSSEE